MLNKEKRKKFLEDLESQYTKAFNAKNWREVLRINFLIEKCYIIDDKQGIDPVMTMIARNIYRDFKEKNPQWRLIKD